jgi:hypothetical protein
VARGTGRRVHAIETALAVAVVLGVGGFIYAVVEGRAQAPDPSVPPVAVVSTPTPAATPRLGGTRAPSTPAAVLTTAPPTELVLGPTPTEAGVSPSVEPTATPTAKPTAQPTAKPTTKPTAKPTAKPVVGSEPEGTPKITTAKGSFGQTLTVQGITVTMTRREPAPGLATCGTSDDPQKQGYTEAVAYELTMTWPKASSAETPWIAVGKDPYFVNWFDPEPVKSGVTHVFATCKRPADSYKAMVEISPPGSPIIYYRWYFS